MCFSAPVSFGASVVLMGLGSAAMKVNKDESQKMFVAMPFIFGLQQLSEGLVWVSFVGRPEFLHQIAISSFLFFALVFWPSWLPWAVCKIEKNVLRKKILKGLGAAGLLLSAGSLWILLNGGPRASILGRSIAYSFSDVHILFSPSIDAILYMATSLLPFFISTNRKVKVTGLLVFGGLALSHLIRQETVASVWCFFAAISSLYIVYATYREQVHRELII